MRRAWLGWVVAGLVWRAVPALSCDVCAIYVATELHERSAGFSLGVGEQLSRFQTLQDDGHEIPGGGQQLTSSITQLALGYDFLPELGVQLTVPLIVRDFRRPEDGELVNGSESGLGDLALLALWRPVSRMGEETTLRVSFLAGVELPTGSTDRLREELDEGHEEGDHHEAARATDAMPRHDGHEHEEPGDGDTAPSGIHGHDLALGSGSVDGIVGAQLFASWRRLFGTANVQYAIRDQGDFGYQYANDLTWSGGPAFYALLEHDYSFTMQANVSGEYKENDTLHGVPADDTAITAVYIGPALAFTWGSSIGTSVGVDLPLLQDNSSIQLVPDFRFRAGLTWRI